MPMRAEMINRALLRIGAHPILSVLDPAAAQHLAIYTSVLEQLASHPFSFFKATRRLIQLGAPPEPRHYKYQYQMPSDMIGAPRSVYPHDDLRQPTTDYDLVDGGLQTDHPAIWLAFYRTRGAEYWPGDFRELFTKAMMAELALSVREDRPLHDRLFTEAFGTPGQMGLGGLMGRALENDSQGTPSTVAGGGFNPLIDVRF